MYAVSDSRPLTVIGVVGTLAKGADEGNHVPAWLHSSAAEAGKHWNAYPWTVAASPLTGSGKSATTSND